MPTYYKPLRKAIRRGQRFGANPGWGPNPDGGHNGDDYLSQVGEPVYAAGDGEVIFAGQFDSTYADNFGWNLNFGGNMIVLNLDGALAPYVEYGHLSDIRVKTGDRVRALQVIALTGESDGGTKVITGPHLHVGVLPPNFNLGTSTYGRVDPDTYLTAWPDDNPGALAYAGGAITQLSEEDPLAGVDTERLNRAVDRILGRDEQRYIFEDTDGRIKPCGPDTPGAWAARSADVGDVLNILYQGQDSTQRTVAEVSAAYHQGEAAAEQRAADLRSLLGSLPPGELAQAIPAGIAQAVADELAQRLAGGAA